MAIFTLFTKKEGSEEKLNRWREELIEILEEYPEDYNYRDINDQTILVKHGSAYIIIDFILDDENGYLILTSPLVYLPKQNILPFYRKLLDINSDASRFGTLATVENYVILARTLPIYGLDDNGFFSGVGDMCAEADELDDLLIEEFKVKPYDIDELYPSN